MPKDIGEQAIIDKVLNRNLDTESFSRLDILAPSGSAVHLTTSALYLQYI